MEWVETIVMAVVLVPATLAFALLVMPGVIAELSWVAVYTFTVAPLWIALAALAVLVWDLFRMFSRNPARRRAENAAFLRLAGPVIRWFKLRRCARRDRDYCYFTCPHCKQMLRAPKGKGKIHVTCRTCGTVFEKTT